MVQRLIHRPKKKQPEHHVDMKLGKGWHKRNFLAEVVIPSFFTKRHGLKLKPVFPKLKAGELCITWIGHASFLVQYGGRSVFHCGDSACFEPVATWRDDRLE